MLVGPALVFRLELFHLERMRLRPGVVANPGHLPRNFDIGLVRLDGETVVRNFVGDDRLGKLADHRQLVAEIAIDRTEIAGQLDRRVTARIRGDIAGVQIQDIRGFHHGMGQVLVRGIKGVVDAEGFRSGNAEVPVNPYSACKNAGPRSDSKYARRAVAASSNTVSVHGDTT